MAITKTLACVSLLAFAFAAQPVFAQNSNDMAPAPANGAPAKQHKHRKAHAKKPTTPPISAPAPQGPASQGPASQG